jgi:hypothetical protein
VAVGVTIAEATTDARTAIATTATMSTIYRRCALAVAVGGACMTNSMAVVDNNPRGGLREGHGHG